MMEDGSLTNAILGFDEIVRQDAVILLDEGEMALCLFFSKSYPSSGR